MTQAIMIALAFRSLIRFLGIGVLVVAILAWFVGWIKDKIA